MHLSKDKGLQNHLRTHPEDIVAAVEEFVRLYTVSALIRISGIRK